jgi:hypothetical protein
MSTRIADLPGSENVINNRPLQEQEQKPEQEQEHNNHTNITADIKRVEQTKKTGLIDIVKDEISEENITIAIFLFLATQPYLTQYIYNIPVIGTYATSDLMTSVIKTIILLIVYIIFKIYLLPKIKL